MFLRHQNTLLQRNIIITLLTVKPKHKMASKESLNNLSVDDLAMTLDEQLCNQRIDIQKIVTNRYCY